VLAIAAHHALLLAASAALAAAGWRLAGTLGAASLERAVGAAVAAGAAAGLSSLGWGLVGLGGSPWVLSGTAGALWLGSRLLPAPHVPPWRRLRPTGWAMAALGVAVAWFAWLARHPVMGIDAITYHLPEAVLWVQEGHPGRGEEVVYEFPIQAYPLTGELLLSWILAIGGSLGVALAFVPLAAALLAAAGWAGLRRLGAPPTTAALALTAVVAIPLAARQWHGPNTDLPGLAWLACTWSLTLAARERRALLGLAVVAGGLAIGTKTTVAPLTVAVLAVGGWRARHALRPHARALMIGLAVAVVVGGIWYGRNLVQHGSPLWPFVAAPWGDPLPPYIEAIETRFVERPLDTVRGRGFAYVDLLGGGLLLIVAALVAGVVVRGGAVALGAAAVAVGVVLWTAAPFTGRADDPLLDMSLSTPRYLLPTLAAAALTLALAARRHRTATWILGAAALVSVERSLALPHPEMPTALWLLGGAAAGGLVWAGARRLPSVTLPAAGAALAIAGLTAAADGLAQRHGAIGQLSGGEVVGRLDERAGADRLHFAPGMHGVLAGDRLQRPLSFIPQDEPCERVLSRRGWVVLALLPSPHRREPFTAEDCLADVVPAFEAPGWRVYDRRQAATTSRHASRPSSPRRKSSGVMAPARGSAARRARVSSRS
jgi:hypothetical protein